MAAQEDHNEMQKRLAESEGQEVYALRNGDGEIANISIKNKFQLNAGEANKMEEAAQTVEGVEGGNSGYQLQKPEPVQEGSQEVANVNPTARKIIEGKSRDGSGGAKMNSASMKQQLYTTQVDLKELTYSGKGIVGRTVLGVKYMVGATTPLKELEKTRDDVERRVTIDQEKVGALDEKIDGIDMLLDGINGEGEIVDEYATRRMMKNAEAIILEKQSTLDYQKQKKAEEEDTRDRAREAFSNTSDETEQQGFADIYNGCEENIVKREKKVKVLEATLSTASRNYNTYFENVERADGFKAEVETQKEYLLLDKATLEGVSYDLKFLLSLGDLSGTGSVAITQIILENQTAMDHYNGLVEGLEKISSRQRTVVGNLSTQIGRKKRKHAKKKEQNKGRLKESNANEVKLALQRIKGASSRLSSA